VGFLAGGEKRIKDRRFAPGADATDLPAHRTEEILMNREHIKGAADKAKGAIKDAAGAVTGDKKLQAEGKFDKAKGEAHNVAHQAKKELQRETDKTMREWEGKS
jgi:uncharacterized protein YjbJ (UPF0337 family)